VARGALLTAGRPASDHGRDQMPTLTRRHALAALGAATATAAVAAAVPAAAAERPRRRVVLVDVDGFDPRLLDGRYADVHPLPRIREMRARGASGTIAATYSSYSNSCRTSTATGAYPAAHRTRATTSTRAPAPRCRRSAGSSPGSRRSRRRCDARGARAP